jgi:hypothetical protein
MIGIVEQKQFIVFCYLSETISLEQTQNLLHHTDTEVPNLDTGDDLCVPRQ